MIYWLTFALLLASAPRGLAEAMALYASVGGGPPHAAADAADLDRLVRESW